MENIYLIGKINEYISFEESERFEEFTKDKLDFEDYNDFQRDKKAQNEAQHSEEEICFRNLLKRGITDVELLEKCVTDIKDLYRLLKKYGLPSELTKNEIIQMILNSFSRSGGT